MLTLFFWFMETQDGQMWEGRKGHLFSFKTKFMNLLQFVAESLHREHIPHYFIRSINLVNVMKVNETETNTLRDVSGALQYMVNKMASSAYFEKLIFDQTAFDSMVLNTSLHKQVLKER